MPKPAPYPRTRIAIPSYQRPEVDRSKFCTARWISPRYWPLTTYYVEPEEYGQYANTVGTMGATLQDASAAQAPREWGSIMDLIIDRECRRCSHLVIMDDDLALAVRPDLPARPAHLVDMTVEDFDDMMDELYKVTTYEVPLASAQYRQFCNTKAGRYQYNQRISMIWSLNSKFFREHPEFRFYRGCGLGSMTDYFFFCNLLAHGHPNVCINKYTKDDKANAPGGISSKRTVGVLNTAAVQLARIFPGYVSVYDKKDKGRWQDGTKGVKIMAARLYKDRPRWRQTDPAGA